MVFRYSMWQSFRNQQAPKNTQRSNESRSSKQSHHIFTRVYSLTGNRIWPLCTVAGWISATWQGEAGWSRKCPGAGMTFTDIDWTSPCLDPWIIPKNNSHEPWAAQNLRGDHHFSTCSTWSGCFMAQHPASWLDMTSQTPSPQDEYLGTHVRFLTQIVTKSIGMLWTIEQLKA